MPCDALYLHIPFCEAKCPYCDFYSVPASQGAMDAYLAALLRALEGCLEPLGPLDTVYFGGGTPSLWGGRRMGAVLEAVARRFGIQAGAEITAECNPHSALPQELAAMAAAGVNRVSLGLQSADEAQLRRLGRLHTAADVVQAVEQAGRAGIRHISLDLMLATPGQREADIHRAVALCGQLGVEHVSAYLLKVEPDTPFARAHVERECPDEDGQAGLYLCAVAALEAGGWRQYEISNFARAGRVARHNLKYWDCREYLGVGPAAHSFTSGQRRFFPRALGEFCAAQNPWALWQADGPGGDWQEYVMLRARLAEGVVRQQLAVRYPGLDPAPLWARAKRLPGHLVQVTEESIRLTPQGFLLSNPIIAALLEG